MGRTSSVPRKLANAAVERLCEFTVELPSWGFADTGTRFGKFLQPAAAITIEDKLDDAGQVHAFTGAAPSMAVHVLWDFPDGFDPAVIRYARKRGVRIGAINPNLFQDQCYKWGSICNRDGTIRRQAVRHILDSIDIGRQTRSRYLSLWFADGANYPGQADIRQRKAWATRALQAAHKAMPRGMTMLIEYKPFEPAAYFTDFGDWGMSYIFAKAAGPRAKVLVDLGHHLPGCNVEQIVAWLIDEDMLGGFHFNDRKYADDDLTSGSIDPYQLFRIFNEIVAAERERGRPLPIAYMIDQSHNLKPKIQAMIQTVCTIQELFAKACLVDRDALARSQAREDLVSSENALKAAFNADVMDVLTAVRKRLGAPADPLAAFRAGGYEARVARERAKRREEMADGSPSSYA
jgi:L-rhamnose isomerase/sugar isomerase